MNKIPYNKPAITYQDQLNQLTARGLLVPNSSKAIHVLENVSYYRLSGYWYPLLADKHLHTFKQSASFDTAFDLYCFDKELRKLVASELEKIEVAIRAKLIYVLSHKYGAFWYQDANLFKNMHRYTKSIANIQAEFDRSDEEFIQAFKKKYSDPLPPSWMIMEITSFGTLSKLYENLKPGKEKRDVANYFGLADSIFENWLHSIVYLRNICAHHTRLWNRVLQIRPQLPRSPRRTWLTDTTIDNKRAYLALCVIKYLLQTVNPTNSFTEKVKDLLTRYPNVDPSAMGFPSNWASEALWN